MEYKLIDNNGENLIVFLTGWGCDDNQFKFMKPLENHDVLLCYDYTNLEFNFDFSKYKKYYLIAFSAGVFIAGLLKEKLPDFEKIIAINGNPEAYDEYYGLRKEIVDVFKGVNKENTMDFRRKYLVISDEELIQFNKNSSQRSYESCKQELVSLQKYSLKKPKMTKFDLAILSDNDKIFYPNRQKEYWQDKHKIRCIFLENTAHFPFFKIDNYRNILNLL